MIKVTANTYVGDLSTDITIECDNLTNALTFMAQYYENTLGAEKCENSENMAQKSVETSSTDKVDWSEAPEWATMYAYSKFKFNNGDMIWTNGEHYVYESCYRRNKDGVPVPVDWDIPLIDVIAKREL